MNKQDSANARIENMTRGYRMLYTGKDDELTTEFIKSEIKRHKTNIRNYRRKIGEELEQIRLFHVVIDDEEGE